MPDSTPLWFYLLLADAVLLAHLLYILFALFGGLLLLHRVRLAWLHVPAMLWAVLVEWYGWICPLTPLENWLLMLGGAQEYQHGFIAQYLLPLLYPQQLTASIQLLLAGVVVLFNLVIYGLVIRHHRKHAAGR